MPHMPEEQIYLGVSLGPSDPSAAAVRGGEVVAFAEEERFVRNKHAYGHYPIRSVRYCLEAAGTTLDEVAAVAVGWNLTAYTDGTMADFYSRLAQDWEVDQATLAWQGETLRTYDLGAMESLHRNNFRREFGDMRFPPLRHSPHHYTHAFQAAMESPFESSVTVTADGSGDEHTTTVWVKRGTDLSLLREIHIPHSLGWFYAAFTEYLGFAAYDGEYKVMGLAAHGKPDSDLRTLVAQVLSAAPDDVGYRVDPSYIHHGEHSFSGRFTDKLVKLLGAPPRVPTEKITDWHTNLAYAVQEALENAACRLVRWAVAETGIRDVCLGGGVAHNVKMNSRILELDEVDDVFAHPLCSDGGGAAGAALVACFRDTGMAPRSLATLALGPQDDRETIVRALTNAKVRFEDSPNAVAETSRALADGKIVGWVEGRLEAGPRALGQRSILADPRTVAIRDRVNEVVKRRELWRPFAPAMPASAADRYFDYVTDSRFMTMAFPANGTLERDAPAIVHTDGTSRVQLVHQDTCPRLHRLLEEFAANTGVPVLLNTSFNVRGEPIVNTTEDALRTFWSTGLDLLVLDARYIVRKGQ